MKKLGLHLKIFVALSLICVVIVLSGCNNKKDEIISHKSSPYEEILTSRLSSEVGYDISKIEFLFSYDSQIGVFSLIRFKSSKKDYEGVSVISDSGENKIKHLIYNEIDRSVPFTHIDFSTAEGDHVFRMVGGQINSVEISYVNISFYNGSLVKVLKSEMNSYAYVDIDDNGGVSGIKGYNVHDELIFEY